MEEEKKYKNKGLRMQEEKYKNKGKPTLTLYEGRRCYGRRSAAFFERGPGSYVPMGYIIVKRKTQVEWAPSLGAPMKECATIGGADYQTVWWDEMD